MQHALGKSVGTAGTEKMSFPHHSHRELKLLLSRTEHTRVHAQLKFLENSNGFLHKLGKLLIEISVYPYNEEVLWAYHFTRMSKEFSCPLHTAQDKSTI